jgi:plastocyanin
VRTLMPKRAPALLVFVALVTLPLFAGIARSAPPTPEPGFVKQAQVIKKPCTATNAYEAKLWQAYGSDCVRLHFAFGPILAKPGQNDALIEPITIEKPAYSGYIVRFRPDLVDETGQAPDIAVVHLHHATWLNLNPQYGNGPFFAAGEEKTIATFPPGYGMHVGAYDSWALLYMVHNATPNPHVVWITYDVDYIADADAPKHHIVPVKPVWLDVQRVPIAPGANNTGANPVYNVQRGFGHADTSSFARLNTGFNDGTGKLVCTWPLENCARHDAYGTVTPQQGKDMHGSIPGADWEVTPNMAGTLIGIGGHLHPGGIRDEVSLVRGGVEKPIFISDSVAWKRAPDTTQAGGPRNSWDFSMGVTGATIGWKVKIKPGDRIRLNAVYDSDDASWYENMGIVVAFVAPNDSTDALHGGPGLDVFDDPVTIDPGFPDTAVPTPGWLSPSCHPNNITADGPLVLCLRGQVTHGHLREANTFGGASVIPIGAKPSSRFVSQIATVAFTYGSADLGVVGVTGIPKVHVGAPLTFVNFDTVADVWHTFTSCRVPCTGTYGLDYPTAFGVGDNSGADFDSTEIGYGLFFSPASGQFGGSNKTTAQALRDGLYATYTPTEPGLYTFYCRIHPSMRGVFDAVAGQ